MGNIPKSIKINCAPHVSCCFRGSNGRRCEESVLQSKLPVCVQRELEEIDGVESKCKGMVGNTTRVYPPQTRQTEIHHTQIQNKRHKPSMAIGFSRYASI